MYFIIKYIKKDLNEFPNENIQKIIDQGLEFFDSRTEFWRQQKPIYSRKKEHSQYEARRIYLQNKAYIDKKGKQSQEKRKGSLGKPIKLKRLYPPTYKNDVSSDVLSNK